MIKNNEPFDVKLFTTLRSRCKLGEKMNSSRDDLQRRKLPTEAIRQSSQAEIRRENFRQFQFTSGTGVGRGFNGE